MKLGFGFYRHMLTPDYLAFARQVGATHAVVHLVDYFKKAGAANPRRDQPVGELAGWGLAGDPDALWTVEEMRTIKKQIEDAGLVWEAIENFDPAHWYDVLLDGPRKKQQLEGLQTIIRNAGEGGIPVIGYNFSIAGVAGRVTGPFARGGAVSVGMNGPVNDPIPNGMVWNMIYDSHAPAGFLPEISSEQLWKRVEDFLDACLPAAEAAGVRLAAHPDDPPMPTLRGQPRLVYRPDLYQKLIDIDPSPSNQLEFCVGTLAEMPDGDVYEAVERYSAQGRIAYVHLRNITGKVPHYRETHIDEGDLDVLRIIRILKKNGFSGVIIPDHAPQLTCEAPWHAGMAFAMGYLRACLKTVEAEHERRRSSHG
ncbi:MAG: mannonate dehydratase [Acidobacteriota bacterium]|nr:mannonate dehydratase [Acidobacteriota bacterium]